MTFTSGHDQGSNLLPSDDHAAKPICLLLQIASYVPPVDLLLHLYLIRVLAVVVEEEEEGLGEEEEERNKRKID